MRQRNASLFMQGPPPSTPEEWQAAWEKLATAYNRLADVIVDAQSDEAMAELAQGLLKVYPTITKAQAFQLADGAIVLLQNKLDRA
jgi:hypothetical protein